MSDKCKQHRWGKTHYGAVKCTVCGASKEQKFVLVKPSGEITQIDDPKDEAQRNTLVAEYVGKTTDYRILDTFTGFSEEPEHLIAVVHDTGILDGFPMHRNRLLSGLAGPAFLGLDDGEEFRGLGTGGMEMSVVLEMLEDAGMMNEDDAEALRDEDEKSKGAGN